MQCPKCLGIDAVLIVIYLGEIRQNYIFTPCGKWLDRTTSSPSFCYFVENCVHISGAVVGVGRL